MLRTVPARALSSRNLHTSSPARAGIDKIVKHTGSAENNVDIPFDFTPESWEKAKVILAKYPTNYKRAAIIPLLDLAQRQHGGWLPISAMNKVAKVVACAPMQVYETASFYSMFNRTPIGKYFVQVCGTTPCGEMGFPEIMKACEEQLGVTSGHTTADKKFTLLEVECLGACVHAPMMQINDLYYEDLTPETTKSVLAALSRGENPKPNSQKGRVVAEPFGPRTSLKEPPKGPYAPFLEQLDKAAATKKAE